MNTLYKTFFLLTCSFSSTFLFSMEKYKIQNPGENFALETPLHKASEKGDIVEVQRLIEAGTQCDVLNKYNETPLHHAAWYGHLSIVQELVKAGAVIDLRNEYDNTPLHYAAWYGHLSIVQELVKAGAVIDSRNEYDNTPLHYALNHLPVVEELIKLGADVNAKQRAGSTALIIVCGQSPSGFAEDRENRKQIVELLLKAGALVNVRTISARIGEMGHTALQSAFERGNIEAFTMLLEVPGIELEFTPTPYIYYTMTHGKMQTLLEAAREKQKIK